jgi:hypothetical protein
MVRRWQQGGGDVFPSLRKRSLCRGPVPVRKASCRPAAAGHAARSRNAGPVSCTSPSDSGTSVGCVRRAGRVTKGFLPLTTMHTWRAHAAVLGTGLAASCAALAFLSQDLTAHPCSRRMARVIEQLLANPTVWWAVEPAALAQSDLPVSLPMVLVGGPIEKLALSDKDNRPG